mmetsp:Transcript_32287/g.74377  ORF Transcript_32287/g.74377 Transcript_32287/m.74377 type:complete len:139 (-) Transcript_32287:424-840(-)
MTKEKLVNLMSETMDGHKNQMLLLPFTEKTRKKRWEFSRTEEGRLLIVVSRGQYFLKVQFNRGDMMKRGNGVLIPDVTDLRSSFLMWLATHKQELLDDQVQTYLANDGHEIIWTPPYVPELQPIELFWGVGKKLRWIL